jgi:hypothetical protein
MGCAMNAGASLGGKPLLDKTLVLGAAGLGALLAEAEAPAVEDDDGLTGGLVEAVGGDAE